MSLVWSPTMVSVAVSAALSPQSATIRCVREQRGGARYSPGKTWAAVPSRGSKLAISCSASTGWATTSKPAITLTEKALAHLTKMQKETGKELCLRVGVRQGGCSGMSYIMDFEEVANIKAEDMTIEHEGFKMVCDPKSLLYLFGMQLDYSDALIGGGFAFQNPNATATCGCGKSFAA